MQFHRPDVDLFIPDGAELQDALARTTHLCVGAHPDDQEFMAYHGIAECFGRPDRWFTGVVVTSGGGTPRGGRYADYTDEQMIAVRRLEQRKAATVGEYACQVQLGYSSGEVKDSSNRAVVEDLVQVLRGSRPDVVYAHNPADKHDTHVACVVRTLDALRSLAPKERPARLLGCEVWRDLDWLLDTDKQVLPVDRFKNLAAALAGVFDSQLAGAKRYDLAFQGRWLANATMFDAYQKDSTDSLAWAMDLTPLMSDDSTSLVDHTLEFIDRFRADVRGRLEDLT